MRGLLRWVALGLGLLGASLGMAQDTQTGGTPVPLSSSSSAVPRPPAAEPVPAAELEAAIEKGQQFLIADQNKDGSWGSAHKTKGLNIYAPVPAAHHAFKAGTTALALRGLLETAPPKGERSAELEATIERGSQWVLRELPNLRRSSSDALYNVWGHAYGISALVKLHAESDAPRRAEIESLLRDQVDRLTRYEVINGGWGYYDFEAQTAKPSGSPTSFTTATVLHVFHEMEASTDVEVSQRIIDRALESVRRQRQPDFTYAYGEYLKMKPRYSINRPGGSLGRNVACNSALFLFEDDRITEKVIAESLDRLFARNLWLEIGRKRPIPHESWFAVAGYFFYYGHYYGGVCIDLVPEAERDFYRDHLARVLLPLQEKDGSWWDYPLYNYHQAYGTGFALLTLELCRKPTAPASRGALESK